MLPRAARAVQAHSGCIRQLALAGAALGRVPARLRWVMGNRQGTGGVLRGNSYGTRREDGAAGR